MSRTTVKIIENNGQIKDIAEIGNSWGSAAFVWSALAEKYFNETGIWWLRNTQQIWLLVDDERLLEFERIVLASTFDYAIIEGFAFSEAAKLFREFSDHYGKSGEVNNLPKIAEILSEQAQRECFGMCFQQTSVAEDLWKTYNVARDDYDDYNLQTDTKHFFVFEQYADANKLK